MSDDTKNNYLDLALDDFVDFYKTEKNVLIACDEIDFHKQAKKKVSKMISWDISSRILIEWLRWTWKSTFLKFLIAEFCTQIKDKKVIYLNYVPRHVEKNQIDKVFFDLLRDKLLQHKYISKLDDVIGNIDSYFETDNSVFWFVKKILQKSQSASLEEQISELSKVLQKEYSDCTIVLCIDEIDRLSQEDLYEVWKLLELVCKLQDQTNIKWKQIYTLLWRNNQYLSEMTFSWWSTITYAEYFSRFPKYKIDLYTCSLKELSSIIADLTPDSTNINIDDIINLLRTNRDIRSFSTIRDFNKIKWNISFHIENIQSFISLEITNKYISVWSIFRQEPIFFLLLVFILWIRYFRSDLSLLKLTDIQRADDNFVLSERERGLRDILSKITSWNIDKWYNLIHDLINNYINEDFKDFILQRYLKKIEFDLIDKSNLENLLIKHIYFLHNNTLEKRSTFDKWISYLGEIVVKLTTKKDINIEKYKKICLDLIEKISFVDEKLSENNMQFSEYHRMCKSYSSLLSIIINNLSDWNYVKSLITVFIDEIEKLDKFTKHIVYSNLFLNEVWIKYADSSLLDSLQVKSEEKISSLNDFRQYKAKSNFQDLVFWFKTEDWIVSNYLKKLFQEYKPNVFLWNWYIVFLCRYLEVLMFSKKPIDDFYEMLDHEEVILIICNLNYIYERMSSNRFIHRAKSDLILEKINESFIWVKYDIKSMEMIEIDYNEKKTYIDLLKSRMMDP